MTQEVSRIDSLAEILEPTESGDKDEVIAETETEGEVSPTTETDTEETKTDGEDTTEKDETTAEGEEAEVDETPAADDGLLTIAEQNKELRQILRAQKKDLTVMKSKLSRLEKKSAATKDDSDLFGEEETDSTETEDVSEFEHIQQQITALSTEKGAVLNTLVEAMEMNPTYADIKEVCSQANFNDMFDAVGEAVAEKEGKDSVVAALEAELAVWRMPNPYKYMYDLIKKYHPSYIATEKKPADTKPDTTPGKTAKELIPAKAPTSLATVPGSTEPSNAWTAERIDAMPEDELDAVPKDVYDKYLAGELDK